jgi:hypothetical protein
MKKSTKVLRKPPSKPVSTRMNSCRIFRKPVCWKRVRFAHTQAAFRENKRTGEIFVLGGKEFGRPFPIEDQNKKF